MTGPLLASGREADVRMLRAFLHVAPGRPARLLDEVVRFRDWQLSGTERLDTAAERVLACAR